MYRCLVAWSDECIGGPTGSSKARPSSIRGLIPSPPPLQLLDQWRHTSPRRRTQNVALPMKRIGPLSCICRRVLPDFVYHQIRGSVDWGIVLRKEEIAIIGDGVHRLECRHYLNPQATDWAENAAAAHRRRTNPHLIQMFPLTCRLAINIVEGVNYRPSARDPRGPPTRPGPDADPFPVSWLPDGFERPRLSCQPRPSIRCKCSRRQILWHVDASLTRSAEVATT